MEPAIRRVARCLAQRAPLGVRLYRRTGSNLDRGNRACHRALLIEKSEEWSYRFAYPMTKLPIELAHKVCSLVSEKTLSLTHHIVQNVRSITDVIPVPPNILPRYGQ